MGDTDDEPSLLAPSSSDGDDDGSLVPRHLSGDVDVALDIGLDSTTGALDGRRADNAMQSALGGAAPSLDAGTPYDTGAAGAGQRRRRQRRDPSSSRRHGARPPDDKASRPLVVACAAAASCTALSSAVVTGSPMPFLAVIAVLVGFLFLASRGASEIELAANGAGPGVGDGGEAGSGATPSRERNARHVTFAPGTAFDDRVDRGGARSASAPRRGAWLTKRLVIYSAVAVTVVSLLTLSVRPRAADAGSPGGGGSTGQAVSPTPANATQFPCVVFAGDVYGVAPAPLARGRAALRSSGPSGVPGWRVAASATVALGGRVSFGADCLVLADGAAVDAVDGTPCRPTASTVFRTLLSRASAGYAPGLPDDGGRSNPGAAAIGPTCLNLAPSVSADGSTIQESWVDADRALVPDPAADVIFAVGDRRFALLIPAAARCDAATVPAVLSGDAPATAAVAGRSPQPPSACTCMDVSLALPAGGWEIAADDADARLAIMSGPWGRAWDCLVLKSGAAVRTSDLGTCTSLAGAAGAVGLLATRTDPDSGRATHASLAVRSCSAAVLIERRVAPAEPSPSPTARPEASPGTGSDAGSDTSRALSAAEMHAIAFEARVSPCRGDASCAGRGSRCVEVTESARGESGESGKSGVARSGPAPALVLGHRCECEPLRSGLVCSGLGPRFPPWVSTVEGTNRTKGAARWWADHASRVWTLTLAQSNGTAAPPGTGTLSAPDLDGADPAAGSAAVRVAPPALSATGDLVGDGSRVEFLFPCDGDGDGGEPCTLAGAAFPPGSRWTLRERRADGSRLRHWLGASLLAPVPGLAVARSVVVVIGGDGPDAGTLWSLEEDLLSGAAGYDPPLRDARRVPGGLRVLGPGDAYRFSGSSLGMWMAAAIAAGCDPLGDAASVMEDARSLSLFVAIEDTSSCLGAAGQRGLVVASSADDRGVASALASAASLWAQPLLRELILHIGATAAPASAATAAATAADANAPGAADAGLPLRRDALDFAAGLEVIGRSANAIYALYAPRSADAYDAILPGLASIATAAPELTRMESRYPISERDQRIEVWSESAEEARRWVHLDRTAAPTVVPPHSVALRQDPEDGSVVVAFSPGIVVGRGAAAHRVELATREFLPVADPSSWSPGTGIPSGSGGALLAVWPHVPSGVPAVRARVRVPRGASVYARVYAFDPADNATVTLQFPAAGAQGSQRRVQYSGLAGGTHRAGCELSCGQDLGLGSCDAESAECVCSAAAAAPPTLAPGCGAPAALHRGALEDAAFPIRAPRFGNRADVLVPSDGEGPAGAAAPAAWGYTSRPAESDPNGVLDVTAAVDCPGTPEGVNAPTCVAVNHGSSGARTEISQVVRGVDLRGTGIVIAAAALVANARPEIGPRRAGLEVDVTRASGAREFGRTCRWSSGGGGGSDIGGGWSLCSVNVPGPDITEVTVRLVVAGFAGTVVLDGVRVTPL